MRLHPDKTRIVYCKDGKRRGSYEHTSFTFLGYGFRVAESPDEDGEDYFFGFNPAISDEAAKRIRAQIRSLAAAPAQWIEPGGPRTGDQHGRAGVDQLLRAVLPIRVWSRASTASIDYLVRWIVQKYKRFRRTPEPSMRDALGEDRQALPEALRPLATRQAVTMTTG